MDGVGRNGPAERPDDFSRNSQGSLSCGVWLFETWTCIPTCTDYPSNFAEQFSIHNIKTYCAENGQGDLLNVRGIDFNL